MDLEDVEYQLSKAKLLGSKGTTGTQASFLELFDGDHEKVKKLEQLIAEKMGYKACFPVSGQTYSRKLDSQILAVLSGIAQSAAKFSNDIRLLQHLKEVEEPFEKNQIGSSAMAYKRNPMRSERIASLARYVIVDSLNPAVTAATQWFERTLDDSANKRISVPEAFLAVDGILNLYLNVTDGLVVYPKVIEQRLRKELPFMATENIMMDAVKRGADRQLSLIHICYFYFRRICVHGEIYERRHPSHFRGKRCQIHPAAVQRYFRFSEKCGDYPEPGKKGFG